MVGHEGCYEVSDHGNVRSVDRWVIFSDGRRRWFTGRDVKPRVSSGYLKFKPSRGRPQRDALLHVAVLEAFVGPRPVGMLGCHNDGNTLNCHISNLRWDTPRNNQLDSRRHGTARNGSGHYS